MLGEGIGAFLITKVAIYKKTCSSRGGGSNCKVGRWTVEALLGKVENQELPNRRFARHPLHRIRPFSLCISADVWATISS